jgi:hypothetical protein
MIYGTIALGFVMIGLGWRTLARSRFVDLQFPGLVSGSIAGLMLVCCGCALALASHTRRSRADVVSRTDDVLAAARAVLEATERT